MEKFIPKFNLYETLAMLIPGAILVYLFRNYITLPEEIFNVGIQGFRFNDGIVTFVLFLTISYLVGVLWHSLMNLLFGFLRNNKIIIQYSIKNLETGSKCLFLEQILQDIKDPKNENISFFTMSWRAIFSKKSDKKDESVTDKYYEAYYYVFSKEWGSSIGSIERQIHFIRNMFIPLIIVFILFWCKGVKWYVILLGFILIIFLFFLMFERQLKVHQAVFKIMNILNGLKNKNKKVKFFYKNKNWKCRQVFCISNLFYCNMILLIKPLAEKCICCFRQRLSV